MKLCVLVCFGGCAEAPALPPTGGCVVRVDLESEASAPDGRSWERAFPSIERGAWEAEARGQAEDRVCQLWVAGGVYDVRDLTAGDDEVIDREGGLAELEVYGGFDGTETELGQRDPLRNPTVLDGGGAPHILRLVTGLVDGVTFRNAETCLYAGPNWLYGDEPLVRDCTFESCGNGVRFVYYGVIENSAFIDNEVGVIDFGEDAHSTLRGCLFRGNEMGVFGGAYVYDSVFAINGVAADLASVNHSVFWGNEAVMPRVPYDDVFASHCTVLFNGGSEADLLYGRFSHSIYWGNDPVSVVDGIEQSLVQVDALDESDDESFSAEPQFVNAPRGWGRTIAGTREDVAVLHDARPFSVGDVLEIADDGVARMVLAVEGASVTFAPPLSGLGEGTFVATWGPGASNLTEDFSLMPDSPAIDAWPSHLRPTGLDLPRVGFAVDADGDGMEECDLGAEEWLPPAP